MAGAGGTGDLWVLLFWMAGPKAMQCKDQGCRTTGVGQVEKSDPELETLILGPAKKFRSLEFLHAVRPLFSFIITKL